MPYFTAEDEKPKARKEIRTKNRGYRARQIGKKRDMERRERQLKKWYR